MNMNKVILRSCIRLIAIISSIYGIIKTYGPLHFTYFTTLSNIIMSLVLFIFLMNDIRTLINKKEYEIANVLYIIKFLATVSITLTFFVFLTILAPTSGGGFLNAYLHNGAGSLCVHFITPILSIIDFILFDDDYKSNKKHAIYGIIPPLSYVLFIVILGQFGVRWFNGMSAPYNFLNYGSPTGWFGFDLSLLGWETLGIGVFYSVFLLSLLFVLVGRIFIFIRNKVSTKKID